MTFEVVFTLLFIVWGLIGVIPMVMLISPPKLPPPSARKHQWGFKMKKRDTLSEHRSEIARLKNDIALRDQKYKNLFADYEFIKTQLDEERAAADRLATVLNQEFGERIARWRAISRRTV